MAAIWFGRDPGEQDKSSRAAIVIQNLIRADADVREHNDVAFYEVINYPPWSQDTQLVKLLVASDAIQSARYKKRRESYATGKQQFYSQHRPSMLYVVAQDGNIELMELLLNRGADVNGYGWTQYSSDMLRSYLNPDYDIVQSLHKELCCDDTSLRHFMSKLHSRCYLDSYNSILLGGIISGKLEVVKLLLEHGVDVKTANTTEACYLIAATAVYNHYRSKDSLGWTLLATVVIDKMLQDREVNDVVFDEHLNDGALKVALYRFSLPEDSYLLPMQKLITKRRAIFIA
jgi:hypothetical protein